MITAFVILQFYDNNLMPEQLTDSQELATPAPRTDRETILSCCVT